MMKNKRVLFRAIGMIAVTIIITPGIATGQRSSTETPIATQRSPAQTLVQGSQTPVQGPGEATILLEIPVDISGYSPNVTRVQIGCSAQFVGDKNRQGASAGGSMAMSQGAMKATAQFALKLTLMKPGEQWSYQCQLQQFYNAALNVWSLNEVWARPKDGSNSNTVVTGTFIVQ